MNKTDIEEDIKNAKKYGDECDKKEWLNLLEKMEEK